VAVGQINDLYIMQRDGMQWPLLSVTFFPATGHLNELAVITKDDFPNGDNIHLYISIAMVGPRAIAARHPCSDRFTTHGELVVIPLDNTCPT